MYFNRKHRAAQDRPDTFLHYCLLPCRFPAPCRQGNGNAGDLHRGPPRSPTIEIICFSPDGTKQLFFGNGKQKRAIEQPFSSRYHFLIFLYTITQNPILSRKLIYKHGNSMQFPCLYYISRLSTAFSVKLIHLSAKTTNILHPFTFPLYTNTETPDFCVIVYFCVIVRFFPQSPLYQRHLKTRKNGVHHPL